MKQLQIHGIRSSSSKQKKSKIKCGLCRTTTLQTLSVLIGSLLNYHHPFTILRVFYNWLQASVLKPKLQQKLRMYYEKF